MSWFKCPACRRVVDDAEHGCQPPLPPARSSSTEAVRRHREKTGNAYGKAYGKARSAAVKELVDRHADEFAELLAKARADQGI